jgi:hypothetical protein
MVIRLALFMVAETVVLGLSWALCQSAADVLYAAAVPGFLVYVALFRRDAAKRLSWRHGVYFGVLGLGVTVALVALAWITPLVHLSWVEVAGGVYFLAALYILLWAADQVLNAGLSRAFGVASDARLPRGRVLPKTALRVLALVLVGGPFVASAMAIHSPKFMDTTDPRQFAGIPFEPVAFCTADNVRLQGWFIPALGMTSETTVIVAPARGMSKTYFLPHALMLADDWFNVLLVDLRGEGGSEGHTRGFGVVEARDVLGALEYLRQARPRQSRHVFALGVSQGASAVLAAARADARIEAVIADSAFPHPAAELVGMTSWLPWPLDGYFRKATLLAASAQLGCNLFQEGACRDIAGIGPRPVLLIHGGEDEAVSVREAEALYSAAGGPAMLWTVRGAGHGGALDASPMDYSRAVCTMLRSVRLGLPPFQWAAGMRGAAGGATGPAAGPES